MILGTIKSYTQNEGVTVLIDGEEMPTQKDYKFLSSYSPVIDDRVLIEEISGTYVIIGKISDNSSSDGNYSLESGTSDNIINLVNGSGEIISSVTVNNVSNANSATNATNATNSTNATNIINQNYPTNNNARIQFRTDGLYGVFKLQYRLGSGSWKDIVNN